MKRFLVLYWAPVSAREQIAHATPEQAKTGMDAWMTWAKKAGNAIVDLGAPLSDVREINRESATNSHGDLVGYSILQGDSTEAVTGLLQEHPHGRIPGFSIQLFECLSMPSEAAKQPSEAA